ncbi:uncharacterized protein LOC128547033 [Mercenaria mercenaria]|uniref:uncharacterized protein LOC128547033 n=1 Tax=Mercenaria mercenaria TaxID=6596 RepID=UPI00234F3252|nr:uncharacterized protein LOC128547033 [Mercenaria mercenaria]
MEIKTQIIVAVFTGLAGILLGIFMVVFAVCYRRRSLSANYGHVNYRKQEADDRVSMHFGQGHRRNYKKHSSSSIDRISQQYERENLNEIELRPNLHQAKWNKRSKRASSSDKRKTFNNENDNGTKVDFRAERLDLHIPRPHTWSEEYHKELTTPYSNTRRHSNVEIQMRHIPRPIVRPYKSELFEDNESTYDYIHLADHQTGDMASHRSSCKIDFY